MYNSRLDAYHPNVRSSKGPTSSFYFYIIQGLTIKKYLYLGCISCGMVKNNNYSHPVYVTLTNAEYILLETVRKEKGYRSVAETLRMIFRDSYMKE